MAAACTMRRPWGALLLLLLLGALLCAHGKRPACKVCPGTPKRPPETPHFGLWNLQRPPAPSWTGQGCKEPRSSLKCQEWGAASLWGSDRVCVLSVQRKACKERGAGEQGRGGKKKKNKKEKKHALN